MSTTPATESIPWSDDPRASWSEAAAKLEVHVAPPQGRATEIVLEGRGPRCHHDFVSTHPVRSTMSDEQARELAGKTDLGPTDKLRRVTAQCCCTYVHTGAPEGRAGCGAPFALWVSWPETSVGSTEAERAVERWSAGPAEPLALEEERQLRAAATTQLADVRKAAESWRTGLAGFLAILVAVFFVKGKDSFDDIVGDGWKISLAALLLTAGVLALYGAYRALRAAYGTPRDEYLGEVSRLFRHLQPTTPRDIYTYGTVSAWHYASARTAVGDLRQAKVATVGAMIAFGAAAAITWFAPGPSPSALAKVIYRARAGRVTTCGKLVESRNGRLGIEPASGLVRTPPLRTVESIEIVKSCP
jgi:hypothetical protein